MKATLGYGASTCSYADWLDADLIVLFGSNVANNQPVTTKYLHHAKTRGAQIAVVNPYREPGLERYWMPSIATSALVRHGARRSLVRRPHRRRPRVPRRRAARRSSNAGGVDRGLRRRAHDAASTRRCAQAAGDAVGRDRARERRARDRDRGVRAPADRSAEGGVRLVDGPDAARARRRHGQGAGQRRPRARPAGAARAAGWCRSAATRACRAAPKSAACRAYRRGHARALGRASGASSPPTRRGWTATEMIDARAPRATVDVFWMVGGNFLETLPDADEARRALGAPRLRVHQDIVLSSSMLVDGAGDVLLLPATTRYESPGGGTETSTERRIIFSPEIPGRRIGSARPEWWVFREVMRARATRSARALVGLEDAAAIRARDRARRAALRRHRAAGGDRATRCSGADAASTPTAASRRRRPGALSRRVALRGRGLRAPAASSSRRGAASSSTRWSSATSIR